MLVEERKQQLALQISNLSNDQVEAVETYLLELFNVQTDYSETGKKYLAFLCGDQLFGIHVSQVVQIIQVLPITPLPNSIPHIKGVVNVREDMIPVVDLRLRLGKPETVYDSRTCIVIVTVRSRPLGLIVDAVNDVETICDADIYELPKQGESEMNYLTGIAKRESVILLLDTNFLLETEELDSLLAPV